MRSTTVGWLTSIVSVLQVTADHMWLNSVRPELRESNSQPIEPTAATPRNSPRIRAKTILARDRVSLEDWGRSGGLGIPQDYHSRAAELVQMRRAAGRNLPLHHMYFSPVPVELHLIHQLIDEKNSAAMIGIEVLTHGAAGNRLWIETRSGIAHDD